MVFKEHNLVMLASKQKAENERQICLKDNVLYHLSPLHKVGGILQRQHLYVTSDEKIEDGDWYIRDGWDIAQADKNIVNALATGTLNKNQFQKIITTTNKSLWKHDDTVPYPKTKLALPQLLNLLLTILYISIIIK